MTRRNPAPPRRRDDQHRYDPASARGGYRRRRPPRPAPKAGVAALPAIILGVFVLLAVGLFGGVMAVYASYTSDLPQPEALERFELNQGSRILSADGVELASFAAENRRAVTFDQIPKLMRDAQVAAEDQTFWTNPCVDFRGIVRAFVQNLSAGETVSGASTICQQLVRSRLFDSDLLSNDRRVERKIKEAILALRVGERYPDRAGKEKLLEMYMNQVYYGNNAYGIAAAAQAYFGKDITKTDAPNTLTVGEAALLAAVVRAPSALDPTKEAVERKNADGKAQLVLPEEAHVLEVQGHVLSSMLDERLITQAQYDAAKQETIVLAPPRSTKYKAPHFVYAARRAAADLVGNEDVLDTQGLTITTTLNYDGYQKSAEKWAAIAYDLDRMTDAQLTKKYGKAALSWIKQLQDRNINNDALVTLNYRTGAVLAYVGSANYDGEASPAMQPAYDVIGQAYRQSGSAFKPITYATGFERGVITPSTMFMDVETEIVDKYKVPNADERQRGPVRVRDALKYSLNIPVAKAQQLIGTDNVVDEAKRMGLSFDPSQDPHVPSLTLGTIGVHMLDLAGAYGAIANGGNLAPPYLIEKITDSSGKVVYDHATDGPKPSQVLSAQSAYLVTDILADNTNPATNAIWGPRFQLKTDDGRRPATLKTGTTNDFRDLQAFGYLAADKDAANAEGAIVTGVWVGNSDFTAIKDVFAADGPTFIWHDYMAEVTAKNKLPVRDFVKPDGIVELEVDATSGMLPGDHTVKTVKEVFASNNQPHERDSVHRELAIEAQTGKIWQEGCGDPETAAPSGSPDPSASPAAPTAAQKVYLDLSGWDADHPAWDAADTAWIERWRGKEDKLPRSPLGKLDAPLAPSETCTPGEVPTSTPTPSPTPTPSATPSPTPTPEATPPPSASPPSSSPSPTPSATPTPAVQGLLPPPPKL
jgi:membrane peptidoglycan carboxypeptidase